jgi:hypothetical protein
LKMFLDLLRMGLVFVGSWVACVMLLILVIVVLVWLGDPRSTPLPRGPEAAWEIVTSAWGLWLLGAGTLTCWLLSNRYCRVLEARAQSRRSDPEPSASPNGGPPTTVASSGAREGPPSVS